MAAIRGRRGKRVESTLCCSSRYGRKAPAAFLKPLAERPRALADENEMNGGSVSDNRQKTDTSRSAAVADNPPRTSDSMTSGPLSSMRPLRAQSQCAASIRPSNAAEKPGVANIAMGNRFSTSPQFTASCRWLSPRSDEVLGERSGWPRPRRRRQRPSSENEPWSPQYELTNHNRAKPLS